MPPVHSKSRRFLRVLGAAISLSAVGAACAPAAPAHQRAPIKNNPRKVVIIGDSLLFKDQDPLYTEVERDGKWDVVDVYAELGATTYRHERIDSILANTNYDAVVLSFGYNEISDVRGDILDPIPESAVRQSWADTVRVAKTQCLGWMTMEYAGWQKIGASENSLMMRMIRWMNNFIRTTGGKVLPVEWGPTIDANVVANWPNGNLWVDSDGFHPKAGSWAKHAMGIKIRDMLDQC